MLVKLFVSNITTDLSFNLSKLQYKHFRKLFEVWSLHQHISMALYRLGGNEKLLEIFA